MEWVEQLYQETKQKWEAAGKPKAGYALFYSPVRENVKMALIGYNPGGDEHSFNAEAVKPPPSMNTLTRPTGWPKRCAGSLTQRG